MLLLRTCSDAYCTRVCVAGLVQRVNRAHTVCLFITQTAQPCRAVDDHVCGLNRLQIACLLAPAGGQGLCWLCAQGFVQPGVTVVLQRSAEP
jgi:hypothetical protein